MMSMALQAMTDTCQSMRIKSIVDYVNFDYVCQHICQIKFEHDLAHLC